MSNCSRHHCTYPYHASAYGLAAEIERPVKQSIPAQAATSLSSSGGHGSVRLERFTAPPFISFGAAYSEVGGSFDDCHNVHTTYASATIEDLNIFDVVTADRVVARMVIYSPEDGNPNGEHSFSITGSRFENLRVAGHPIDVELATPTLHEADTFSKFESVFHGKAGAKLLPWGDQDAGRLDELVKDEQQYHALEGIGTRAKRWSKSKTKGAAYWVSAAGHFDLDAQIKNTELKGYGGIILVPKFGIVRLAELVIRPHHRMLTMFNVQMCSGTHGGAGGGSSSGGGGTTYP